MLGFFRIASSFLDEVIRHHPDMLHDIMVVDFNPEVRSKLEALGIPCVYGDLASPDTLHHAELGHARVVICTVPDAVLKGVTNEKIIGNMRELCPHAQIIVTGESPGKTRTLYDSGADYVIQPYQAAGSAVIPAVHAALIGNTEDIREQALEDLFHREEILH
jgi:voltage-gated potassium channel Kch